MREAPAHPARPQPADAGALSVEQSAVIIASIFLDGTRHTEDNGR